MMRARMWRTIAEEGAVEATKQRHRDIYLALRAGDAERASAADRLHLAEGEEWLRHVLNAGDTPAPIGGTAPGNGKGTSP
jgi:DNA-binding FadR family transcriptional regulator